MNESTTTIDGDRHIAARVCLRCGNRSMVAHGGGFKCRDCGAEEPGAPVQREEGTAPMSDAASSHFPTGHWFDTVFPWEEPSRWHPIQRWRWRRRHERIRYLEAATSDNWKWRDLPWDSYGY